MNDKERLENGQILSRVIIEMLGAPKEHIEKTLQDYIAQLKQDKDLKIIKEEYDEAVPQGKLFTTFVELELWCKNMEKLFLFCMESMPSNIEILEPSQVILKTSDLSSLLNDLQGKVHKIDFALKALSAENKIIAKNNGALVKNIVIIGIKSGNTSVDQLSKVTGIPDKQMKGILDELVARGSIKKKGETYLC